MACQYFVNGDWVTENQLKELLNAGLLDTLISDGTVAIKGFKTDAAKVLKAETTEERRNEVIPAVKLANILANEVKTRQGYPLNMLSALELNEAGTDFKIPLWASPYKDKFESLLTSLVSNKIVKQKFPGNSYVLGSQEGFQFKEGDEAAGELKNSNIVFSANFDPSKGLQPMRWDFENKKILPAQIMIPFKFRDENGNILALKDFMIKGEDGRMMLDTTKLPEKLLQLFGFRIPTQERNSMAAVEIVGFLPEASGDLMLAPRDFTKQMGSDFDVDKMYTYMYNHFYKDGKLQTGFMSNKKKIAASLKIQKQHLDWIKKELKLNKEDRKLIDAYIEEKIEYAENGTEISSELAVKASELIASAITKNSGIVVFSEGSAQRLTYDELTKTLDNTVETISILNRSYKAARQNNILDIHLRIMKSSNPEIINSIMALDSFGEFEGLAKEINNIRNAGKPLPNILSDTYQRTKFINATAGKNGVGSFSLDSTFNATAQGKEITLQNLTEEAQEELFGTFLDPKVPTTAQLLAANMPLATFGEIESKGDLSNKYTLKSQALINLAKLAKRDLTIEETESLKLKSSIIRALQSTAVDNEKAQILDKLNINDETFDVIRALTLLGFEEQEIVGLITQEIVWEYVDKLRDAGSSLTSYNPNAAAEIFAELAKKYDPKGDYAGLDSDRIEQLASKSGKDLIDNIKNKTLTIDPIGTTPDYNLEQLALLEKFQNLAQVGKDIKVLQSTINTESSGIPKSLLETQSKVEQVQRLPYLNIFNANKLLGEYEKGTLSEPTTINGYASYYGTMFADKIFNEYFPYKNVGFKTVVTEVKTHMPKGADMSVSKTVETQGEVFNEIRSYLYANTSTNLFGENPDVERRRLFIDSKKTATKPKNVSLATILQTLSLGANSKSWYQKNGFLNKLSFDINKNGTISRINFEAAAGENFDERNIYDGFNYLLSKNFSIGNFNGIDYTSRILAQELIAAAFLEGGTQGSKQYLKFVPIAYLKSLGFGEYLQGVPFDFVSTFYGNVAESGPIYAQPSTFTRQYFQNNPDKVKTVSLGDLKGKQTETPKESFTLNDKARADNFVEVIDPLSGEPTQEQTHFLSIYDNKLPSKYALYEFDSVDRLYRRISVLAGSYGFVGYNSQNRTAMPVEVKNLVTTPMAQQIAPGYTISNIPTAPTKAFDINTVNNTVKKDTAASLPINRNLAGTKEALDDLLNNLEGAEGVSTLNTQLLQLIRGLELPENFKVTYVNNRGRGSYNATSQILNVNLAHVNNQEINKLATTVAHELIHALTARSIKDYQSGNIEGLSARTIKAIQQLETLQKLYIDELIAKEGPEGLKAFEQFYKDWKEGADVVPNPANISKYYGAIKLEEFVTMALTDVGFQEHLNSITDETGVSLWEQLKELLADLLNALGLDINPGSALATAVKDSMNLIQANQETLKENNIETKEFFESGNSYKFQVDGNGKVVKAEYAQGNGIFKAMNAKNGQKKYDELKNKPNTQGAPTTQPSASIKEGAVNNKYELFPGVFANAGQTEAIDKLKAFLNSDEKAFLLEGKGGTGKTTIIKQILSQVGDKKILAIAPSHKAKKVLAKSLKGIDADIRTLASALAIKLDESTGKFEPDTFARDKGKVPIKNGQIIVIDESSMVSDSLLSEIKKWVSQGAKVIFMGDRAQLPPVGQEKDSDVFGLKNSYTLTEKMRQAATSPIIGIGSTIAANAENNTSRVANPITSADRVDMFDAVSGSSITWEKSEDTALNQFVSDVQQANGDVNFAKIVTFNNQNHSSPQSVKNLNNKVREKLFGERARTEKFIPGEIVTAYDSYNPNQGKEELDIIFFNSEDMTVVASEFTPEFRVNVSVYSGAKGRREASYKFDVDMLTLNNDEGALISEYGSPIKIPVIAESSKAEYAATLKQLWGTDRQLAYALQAKFANLEYGYALTSHKAQGSTYTNVYVMEDNIMGPSNAGSSKAKNQSLYVAVSRPTTKLVMVSAKNTGVVEKSTGLNLAALGDLADEYRSMPTSNYGDDSGSKNDNNPSPDDWDAYNKAMGTDELLGDSTFNSEEFRNYLLICGK